MSQTTFKLTPNPALGQTRAYGVPKSSTPTDLRLSGNEGLWPSEALMNTLATLPASVLRDYPSTTHIEQLIAQRHGVDPSQVLITAGADDALYRICQAMLGPGRALLISTPTFEMIPRYARLTGAEVKTFEWLDGPYPLDTMSAHLSDEVKVVAVISPNNPTGAIIDAETLRKLEAQAPNALILLDHAYVEFAQEDLTELALTLDRVVVTRTFSKAWGLAGLRTGYAIGPAEVITWLRAAGNPYAVTGPSLALVETMLQTSDEVVDTFVQNAREQRQIIQELATTHGATCTQSEANFVFGTVDRPLWWRDVMAGLGIAIRVFPGTEGLTQAFRMSCPGTKEGLLRVQGAFGCLNPEAILLDMDGVMVDVSQSYRDAIILTAKHFGVEITGEDISAFKARGDANNDWKVTHAMITERGVVCTLEEVTEHFEMLYQGTEEQPGFWTREACLISRQTIDALKKHARLGIVTGRPRRDAMRFLAQFDMTDDFEVVICMEDGPAKPHPAPIIKALEALNAQTAWMIGDTPDDIHAARRATEANGPHVLPLGVFAPQDRDDTQTRDALLLAGAGRILSTIEDLPECLP